MKSPYLTFQRKWNCCTRKKGLLQGACRETSSSATTVEKSEVNARWLLLCESQKYGFIQILQLFHNGHPHYWLLCIFLIINALDSHFRTDIMGTIFPPKFCTHTNEKKLFNNGAVTDSAKKYTSLVTQFLKSQLAAPFTIDNRCRPNFWEIHRVAALVWRHNSPLRKNRAFWREYRALLQWTPRSWKHFNSLLNLYRYGSGVETSIRVHEYVYVYIYWHIRTEEDWLSLLIICL